MTSKSSEPYGGASGRSQNENERKLRWTVCTDVEILPGFLTDGDTESLTALQKDSPCFPSGVGCVVVVVEKLEAIHKVPISNKGRRSGLQP